MNKAAPRGSRPERAPRQYEPRFRIYVGNIPWDVDDSRLEQVFSEYGKVIDSRVVYDRESGRSRGFAFVTMSAQQEMDDAIAGLDGQVCPLSPFPSTLFFHGEDVSEVIHHLHCCVTKLMVRWPFLGTIY